MIFFNIDIQRQVIAAALDDFSPNAALPNLKGGPYGDSPDLWRQDVVEFITNMIQAGLLVPLPGNAGYEKMSAEELKSLLLNEFIENSEAEIIWDALYLSATNKLIALVKKLQLYNWDAMHQLLCPQLGDALAQMHVVSAPLR